MLRAPPGLRAWHARCWPPSAPRRATPAPAAPLDRGLQPTANHGSWRPVRSAQTAKRRTGRSGGTAGADADSDPAANKRAEHGEEAPVRVLDRRAVRTVRGHVRVLVEQVLPRDADVIELDATVVHAGQPTLVMTISGRHTRQVIAVVVADR